MTTYIDNALLHKTIGSNVSRWSHLLADNTEELVTFAARLGLGRAWLRGAGTWQEHFPVPEPKRAAALRMGAVEIIYGPETRAFGRAKHLGEPFDLAIFRATAGSATSLTA